MGHRRDRSRDLRRAGEKHWKPASFLFLAKANAAVCIGRRRRNRIDWSPGDERQLCANSGRPDKDAIDPDVWSGRALQEVSSTWQMRSCINVSGL